RASRTLPVLIRVRPPPASTPLPYTTLFRSQPAQGPTAHGLDIQAMEVDDLDEAIEALRDATDPLSLAYRLRAERRRWTLLRQEADRKSTRLNSSHVKISYAVFCLKKKKASE